MSHIKTRLAFLLLVLVAMPSAFAQNTSTQGKEFWLSYMHNGFKDHDYGGWVTTQVLISAKRACTGVISNPAGLWQQEFSVEANSITTIDVPERNGYHDGNNYEQVEGRGVRIVATDTISVYTTNIAYVSFDASFVLPVESLGDDYIVQCHDQSYTTSLNSYVNNNLTSAFLIVATENDTEIDITPTVSTLRGHAAGETFTITLNAGQTYHVRSNRSSYTDYGRDLSGTRVTAHDCKKIAVFNGNTLTSIPTTMTNGYDHVYEQAMPLRSWGKNFVVTSSTDRNRDFVKITSAYDNNVITKNGNPLTTLRAGQSYTFSFSSDEGSCFLSATQPCAVYLYNNSSYDQNPNGGFGDPSMVWIAPVEQRIDEVTFTTFNNSDINITNHYVNIIINSEDANDVYLDDELLSPLSFRRVNGNDEYSYTSKEIRHGVHHLRCTHGFNAHVYGFGSAKGYAYLVGSNAIDLSTKLNLNDLEVMPNAMYQYCVEEPITFQAEVNYETYDLMWDFGDGQTSTQNPASHTYHSRQIYPASLIVTADEAGCVGSASDTTLFYIDVTQQYVDDYDTICMGGYYSGHGFNNVLIMNDTILWGLKANPINTVCNDSLRLHIHANPTHYVRIHDSRCWHNQPEWYNDNGFHFEYDHPDTYTQEISLTTIHGCDSIVTLTLDVADQITTEIEHHECNGTYHWNNQTYTQPGIYEQQFTSVYGCDSVVTLHLTMGHNRTYEFDTITCGGLEWNGISYHMSGDHVQTLSTYDGCDSVVTCHHTVSGTVDGGVEHLSGMCDTYNWLGHELTASGYYSDTLSTILGCDSIVHLDLQMQFTPNPSEILPADTVAPHWVIPATEFQINAYTFRFYDHNRHCVWDSVSWQCTDKFGNHIWAIDPYIDSTSYNNRKVYFCDLYAIEAVQDTIMLTATAYNGCDPVGVSQEYWMVCSFYGTEEHENSKIDIIPNPNNGTMTLQLDGMLGETQISVYDMAGILVDRFSINATNCYRHSYQLPRTTGGLYLFVINNRGTTTTQKVIITQ